MPGVGDRQERAGKGPGRGLVETCGQPLPERFVWPLRVVAPAKPIKASLLRRKRAAWRPRGLGLEGFVHPLVATVLLGVRGLNELGPNPQADPPHRERREPAQGRRRKRRAVIGADPLGQAVAAKEPLKYGPTRVDRRLPQSSAAEQKARSGILDRQRVAVDPIAGPELPFEIGTPDHVGLIKWRVGAAGVKAAPGGATVAGAAVALEDAMDGRDRRDELARHALSQEPTDFARAPPKASLQGQELLHDRTRRRMRTAIRPMRAIGQTGGTRFLVPLEPFVAGLPAHLVAATDLGDRPAWSVDILHKPQSHIHE